MAVSARAVRLVRPCLGALLVGGGACTGEGIGSAEMPATLQETAEVPPSHEKQAAAPAPHGPSAVGDEKLCRAAAEVAPQGMDLDAFDADDYVAQCVEHLGSDKAPAWREFYGCVADAGDGSWLRKCIKKSPGRG